MTAFLTDLPYLAVAGLLVIAIARTRRDIRQDRQERREAAARAKQEAERRAALEAERLALAQARHPSRRAVLRQLVRPPVPGRYPDGEPLSHEDLQKYTEIMFRETSADEGAE
jgi:hypothetical protein